MIVQDLTIVVKKYKMSRVNYLIQETGIVASLWKQYIDRKKSVKKKKLMLNIIVFMKVKMIVNTTILNLMKNQ